MLDECDIASQASSDCNGNGVPDECEALARGDWRTASDFAQGTPINVGYVGTGCLGGLQRNDVAHTQPLPYLWIAASGRGTVMRIDSRSGQIIGEYRSAPQWHAPVCTFAPSDPNCSRTTVDLDGCVFATNRGDNAPISGQAMGSAVKIGLVVGGRRVNADGSPNDAGGYIKHDPPEHPITYCTCEDRNGDGLIRTSAGLGDILTWYNFDGRDDAGASGDPNEPEVNNAEDECIVRYIRTGGTGLRTVAVDKDNNLWVGGTGNFVHEKRNGFSGEVMQLPDQSYQFNHGIGGYGGVVAHFYDPNNPTAWPEVLWSAGGGDYGKYLLRYVTSSGAWTPNDTHGNYGLGFDPLTGRIWHTSTGERVYEIDPLTNTVKFPYYQEFTENSYWGAKGVAVDNHGDVWIAQYDGEYVLRLAAPSSRDPNDAHTRVGSIGGFSGTTGVAVDADGKVWVSERDGNRVTRIDPNDPNQGPAGTPDLTVPLGDGAGPYNYSDMTGLVGLHTSGTGTWTVVHDSTIPQMVWGKLVVASGWADDGPVGCSFPPQWCTGLEIGVRAADNRVALPRSAYTSVASPGNIPSSVVGRFIEIRVRFHGPYPSAAAPLHTPVLHRISALPPCDQQLGDVDGNNYVDGRDIQPLILLLLGPSCTNALCAADMNRDGYVDLCDIPCFIAKLLTGHSTCEAGGGRGGSGDCNANDIPDDNDIADGTSQDCNHNFIPDECDLDPNDPDGDGLVSIDVNSNGVPDGCEADCNGNGIPDEWDIATCDPNDPNNLWCQDVNSNGIPDGCEPDCNANGIPDDWDLVNCDPDDPNQLWCHDCNANGVPDGCEADCNGNGVPDDCDIANQTSLDCNGNGYPDECDIALGPSWGEVPHV